LDIRMQILGLCSNGEFGGEHWREKRTSGKRRGTLKAMNKKATAG